MRRGRPLEISWQEEAVELNKLYRQEKNVHRRDRLHVLWLICIGKTLSDASQVVGIPYSTANRWVEWYRSGGLEEVLKRIPGQSGGNDCQLTSEQQAELRAVADSGAFRTAREVQKWIANQWGINYRRAGVYSLLRRMKISWKVPRRQSDQANPQAQEAWKKGGWKPN